MSPNDLYTLPVGAKVRLTSGLAKGKLFRKCHGYWVEMWEGGISAPRAWVAQTKTHICILSARPELVSDGRV